METSIEVLLQGESSSADSTEELGTCLGERLGAGTVLALTGELGAGKTCFVRGLARGLGISDPVSSPTYILMQTYLGGRLPLYHFDAWMEGRETALFEDGGDEWLRGLGVAAVEWAGRVEAWLPHPYLRVDLEHLDLERRNLRLSLVSGPQSELAACDELRRSISGLIWPTQAPTSKKPERQ